MLDFILEQTDVYEYLRDCGKPIAIYGMGNGADKLFNIFSKKKIDIAAVFASDDFVRGHSFREYKVKKYSELCEEFGDFVIVPAFATRLPEIMKRMDNMDCEREVRFPELPVIGDEPIDKEFISENIEDIRDVYEILADELSKKVFASLINFRISGKLSYLREIMTDRDEIFRTLGVTSKEVFADLGAYDGDTLEEFFNIAGGFKHAVAIEPDRRNFRKLMKYAEGRADITLVNKAVSSSKQLLRFNDKAGRNSALDESGRCEVEADSPDNIFADIGVHDVSFVKMDVEGAEIAALEGLRNTIFENKPKLCICAYHKREDLWRIPKFIKSLNWEYKIYLRKHLYYPGWETAYYCK